MDYEKYIGVVEGFPKPGISFKDITPLLNNPKAFASAIDEMSAIVKKWKPDLIIGPESRGFIFGVPIAYKVGCGFAMARKKGKLPGDVISKTYTLEYSTTTIELPAHIIRKGERVVLVDDLLATGGTLNAVKDIVVAEGAEVVGAITMIELTELKGRDEFTSFPYASLLKLGGA
jgi:adenine phosphoribosyltransferase